MSIVHSIVSIVVKKRTGDNIPSRDVSLGRKTLSPPCPHPIGMRLKEASRWDAMIFFAFSSTERNIPNGMSEWDTFKVSSL